MATTSATIETISQTIDNYFAPVKKLPLTGPDNMKSQHFGLFRMDTGTDFPVTVKKGYVPHTNDDMKAIAEASIIAFDSAQDAQITCSWTTRGQKIIIAPSKDFRRSIFGTKDNIFPRMIIEGQFGSTFNVETGLYRDACRNLMRVKSVSESLVKIRHCSHLRDRMAELIEACNESASSFEQLAAIAAKLEAKRMKITDFLAELYPAPETDSKKALTQAKNRASAIYTRLLRERMETGRKDDSDSATLWELLNSVTGYVQHDKARRKLSGGMVERALLAIDDSESENAWNYAIAMAG